ncbi:MULTISPECIES: cytochrome oxidase putative small subunit CydP [unclassified Burkholderia]|uniref:cytochrome oxidase putative small subunit CydP n=1 Tax=unclassified Burkholderia TaxID=2613784 RepID=UPI00158858CF|nr:MULTISPECIES: cytochrome oxidase putative small subunit CydP [unclassified Burkholderia]
MISIKKEPAPPSRPAGTIGWRARIAAWARGPTLARDITLVLIVKLILLMSLKYAFFNHPQAQHMSLPPAAVAERLLSVPAPASTEGDHHDK